MEWFKCIDEFNEKEQNAWNADGSVLIDLDAWKRKDKLEDHLVLAHKDYSVGRRKGLKKYIVRFVGELDDSLMQIGNESFYTALKDYKKETVLSLKELWMKACKVYFNNEEGKALYTRNSKDVNENGQLINAVIPFGPWVSWDEEDWEDVVYKYRK